MTGRITVFGYGPVGRATAARLIAEGREVIVAQRNAPSDLPKGATFVPVDALDRDAVAKAVRGSGQFVVAIGFSYSGVVWRDVWPRVMANFVAACRTTGARMVFMDNLYMYGPQTTPLIETMALSGYGLKPAARAVATRVWMAAAATGEARVAALRAPDFYGPGVGLSFLGDTSIGKLAQASRQCSLARQTCCTTTPMCRTLRGRRRRFWMRPTRPLVRLGTCRARQLGRRAISCKLQPTRWA